MASDFTMNECMSAVLVASCIYSSDKGQLQYRNTTHRNEQNTLFKKFFLIFIFFSYNLY